MDVWGWLALSVCPLTIVGLGIACARMLTTEPEAISDLMAWEAAKLAAQAGLRSIHSNPDEVRKDILRKHYKELTHVLTDEDKEWVTEQMKLTGFDPSRERYSIDSPGYQAIGNRWPKGML